jgi:hypothetical protein
MEPVLQPQEFQSKSSIWNKVTPLSKYIAMVLFVAMPFVGGYVGYRYAPDKIVEVEKTVIEKVEKEVSDSADVEDDFIHMAGNYYKSTENISREPKIFYKNAYWDNESSNQNVVYREIVGADIETFQVDEFSSEYATDKSNVYYFWRTPFEASSNDGVKIIEGADPDTFEAKIVRLFPVSQGNTYQGRISRDDTSVFYRGDVIDGADPNTYTVGENVSINFDDDDVFLWHEKIPKADPKTYEVIFDTSGAGRGTVFGRDSQQCYRDSEVINCSDVPSTEQEARGH